MAKVCVVTGRKAVSGHRVSHANNKAKRTFEPNLHDKRFWSQERGRFVRLRVSAKAMKTIDKLGLDAVLRDLERQGVSF